MQTSLQTVADNRGDGPLKKRTSAPDQIINSNERIQLNTRAISDDPRHVRMRIGSESSDVSANVDFHNSTNSSSTPNRRGGRRRYPRNNFNSRETSHSSI